MPRRSMHNIECKENHVLGNSSQSPSEVRTKKMIYTESSWQESYTSSLPLL